MHLGAKGQIPAPQRTLTFEKSDVHISKFVTTAGHQNLVLGIKFPSFLIVCGLRFYFKKKSEEESRLGKKKRKRKTA